MGRVRSVFQSVCDCLIFSNETRSTRPPFSFLERALDFFKIGIKTGFYVGLALVLLFPVFHF